MTYFLPVLAALVVYKLIERIAHGHASAQQARWDRKYRGAPRPVGKQRAHGAQSSCVFAPTETEGHHIGERFCLTHGGHSTARHSCPRAKASAS